MELEIFEVSTLVAINISYLLFGSSSSNMAPNVFRWHPSVRLSCHLKEFVNESSL